MRSYGRPEVRCKRFLSDMGTVLLDQKDCDVIVLRLRGYLPATNESDRDWPLRRLFISRSQLEAVKKVD